MTDVVQFARDIYERHHRRARLRAKRSTGAPTWSELADEDREDRIHVAARLARAYGWTVAVGLVLAVALNLAACAHAPAKPVFTSIPVDATTNPFAGPIEVKIVAPIPHATPDVCYSLHDIPTAPETITMDRNIDDVMERTTVNIRRFNEQVEFDHLMAIWAEEVANCIDAITNGTP